jgi:uncharacterized tellurite resistance protein B-like protein
MDTVQHLYYALGEAAYAIAKADGTVQPEERKKIHDIVVAETAHHKLNFDYAEIIFHILKKDDTDSRTSYQWAINEFRKYKKNLSPDMAIDFIGIVEKVSAAARPGNSAESLLVEKFRKDMKHIAGLS